MVETIPAQDDPKSLASRWLPMRRWEWILLFGLLCLGGALRFAITSTWTFAGSDSYGYVALADELFQNGRLALGPDEPLAHFRPPLYAVFIALVKQGAPALKTDAMGIGWRRILYSQALVEIGVMGPLLWAMARDLGGRLAGTFALLLGMLFPVTVVFVGAALTESLAMSLTVATVAPLILLRHRPRIALSLFGIGVGLSLLLRTDGILLALAGIPLVLSQPSHRLRLSAGMTALLAFVLAVSPWGIRNVVHFGNPHLLGSHLDRFSRPVPHHIGFWRWLCSWAPDYRPLTFPQSCFYDLGCPFAVPIVEKAGAFVSFDDREAVERLSALRRVEGISVRVSDEFTQLAKARQAASPFRVLIALPLLRTRHMWIARHDEVLQNPSWRPVPALTSALLPLFPLLVSILLLSSCLGALAFVRNRTLRGPLGTLLLPILARSFVLPYFGYAMPRYAVEAMVLCFIVATAGNALWLRRPA